MVLIMMWVENNDGVGGRSGGDYGVGGKQ